MSDPSEFDTPDSPPPPAYELSQQHFDQKTARVIEASRSDPHPSGSGINDDFELWDDEIFERAAAALRLTGSSSGSEAHAVNSHTAVPSGKGWDGLEFSKRPPVEPLRIVKGGRSTSQKIDPAWHTGDYQAVPPGAQPSVSTSAVPHPGSSPYHEREPTPPPVFEAVGPSLDGPAYEPAAAPVILTYNTGDSRAASPLTGTRHRRNMSSQSSLQTRSPPPQLASQPQSRQRPPLPQPPPPLPSPSPPRPNLAPPKSSPMPRGHHNPPPVARYNPQPRVIFDPQMAYARKVSFLPAEEELPPRHPGAAAFYNSAVSSHVSFVSTPAWSQPQSHVRPSPQPGPMQPLARPVPTYSQPNQYQPPVEYQPWASQQSPQEMSPLQPQPISGFGHRPIQQPQQTMYQGGVGPGVGMYAAQQSNLQGYSPYPRPW